MFGTHVGYKAAAKSWLLRTSVVYERRGAGCLMHELHWSRATSSPALISPTSIVNIRRVRSGPRVDDQTAGAGMLPADIFFVFDRAADVGDTIHEILARR
jgi:hypothetical protein